MPFCCQDCQQLPPLQIVAGESFNKILTVFDAEGAPIAFQSGATASFWIITVFGDSVTSFVASILPNPAIGQIKLEMPPIQTQNLSGGYVWGCKIVNGTSTIRLASNFVRIRS